MALGTNFHPDLIPRRAGLERVAAGTHHIGLDIIWMYFFFHLVDSSINRELYQKSPPLAMPLPADDSFRFSLKFQDITSLLDNFIYSFYLIFEDKKMLCKRTYKNQITLPKKVMEQFEGYDYFEVRVLKGKIVLEPVKMIPKDKILLERIRDKIAALGLTPQDIEDAIGWARKE